MKKGSKAGYVLQLICGFGMLLYGLWQTIRVINLNDIFFYLMFLAYCGLPVLYIVFAVLGKKRVWPNVINLIMIVFPLLNLGSWVVSYFRGETNPDWFWYYLGEFILCLLGLIGSGLGIIFRSMYFRFFLLGKRGADVLPDEPPAASASDGTSSATLPPFKAKLLQKSADTVIRFENDEGESLELDLVDTVYFKENGPMRLYAVLQKEGEEGFFVAQYDEEKDALFLTDQETAERVLNAWAAPSAEKTKGARKRLKLDIVDTIVHQADWKAFRKRASQDELFALAVGSRYQLDGAKPFVKTFLAVAGAILAIVLMVSMEFGQIGIIGGVAAFFACNLIACKQLGYYNTLNDCRWKLDSEHSQLLKDLFPEIIFVAILRWLFMILLMIITMPYQAILMLIEILIPAARNWTVAHGGNAGAVISMPKGCDIGGLGAMGAYYASQKFGDVWDQHMQEVEAAKLAKFKKYTYTDQYGMTQEAYSDDGKTFYEGTNKLKEVGTSKDGGKMIGWKVYSEEDKTFHEQTTGLKEINTDKK